MAILEEGMKFTPFIGNSNEQNQYKELLTYFVYEVARLLNIPPSKLHQSRKSVLGQP